MLIFVFGSGSGAIASSTLRMRNFIITNRPAAVWRIRCGKHAPLRSRDRLHASAMGRDVGARPGLQPQSFPRLGRFHPRLPASPNEPVDPTVKLARPISPPRKGFRRDYLFHLDALPEPRIFTNWLELTGWLLHRNGKPIHGLRAMVQPRGRRARTYKGRRKRERPAIGAAYPHLPEAAMSGFLGRDRAPALRAVHPPPRGHAITTKSGANCSRPNRPPSPRFR